MKKFKKIISCLLTVTMLIGILAGCNSSSANSDEVYFLNFKPEIADVYKKIAEDYKTETGKIVKVETAAANTYEQTLKAEVGKSNAPTIFQINGPVGYQAWAEYCLDLKSTNLYNSLTDKGLAVTSGDGVYGIPYVVEGYGIIYNDAIMEKYFASGGKVSSMEEIKDFATLKSVVEDMTSKKDDLGIEGVFASTSLSAGEDWRWQTHLSNISFYYEFLENKPADSTILTALDAKEIEFKYSDNFKNIFDLYINNSITEKTLLGGKSVDDSMAEFALGKVAMVQNGNWAWSQISGVDGNTVNENDIKFLPMYTGMPQDKEQGLAIGTENYFAINSKVSKEKQDASIAFLEWLFSSETGKKYVTGDLGFIAPFNTFNENEKPSDPLAKEILKSMESGASSVPWAFSGYPSEEFKAELGSGLLEYAQGNMEWDEVIKNTVDKWASERAK